MFHSTHSIRHFRDDFIGLTPNQQCHTTTTTTTTTATTNVRIIVLPPHSCGGTLQNLYLNMLHIALKDNG